MHEKTLFELRPGESGTVAEISAESGMRRRFMDIGCIAGATIKKLSAGPFGDPCAYLICGAVIAIRERDAAQIVVT